MTTTIYDIARKAGVATATVSVVLNNKQSGIRVSQETRQRIFRVAEELNYRPSFSARSLARGKTFSLGFLTVGMYNPHFAELTHMALQKAADLGYHLLVSLVDRENQTDPELELLLRKNIDGLIVWGHTPGAKQYQHILKENIPIILCQSVYKDLPFIRTDWTGGVDETLAYLAQRGKRRVGFINLAGMSSKKKIFITAYPKYGILPVFYETTVGIEESYRLGKEIALAPNRPEVLITFSDYNATGLIRGLAENSLRVPEDIGIVGSGDSHMGRYYNPPLTTISQGREEMLAKAFELVMGMIEKKQLIHDRFFVPTHLVVRKSV
jgi:LacI family transcriptional regulator, sucrose operon repressor